MEGEPLAYLRVRGFPFPREELRDFVERYDKVYVVEQNRDGQMADLLRLEVPDLASRFRSITTWDGLPLSAGQVLRSIDELCVLEV